MNFFQRSDCILSFSKQKKIALLCSKNKPDKIMPDTKISMKSIRFKKSNPNV